MRMIDFHNHILPNIDDGASSVDESMSMLQMLLDQGADTICLTPHFYPNRDNPDDFLEKRSASFKTLMDYITDNPESSLNVVSENKGLSINSTKGKTIIPMGEFLKMVKQGAEVAYFPGMGRSEEISRLCLEGTDYLLIEMPFSKWTQSIVDDIRALSLDRELKPVLAHIERYTGCFSQELIYQLINEDDVLLQMNTSTILDPKSQDGALKMIQNGYISFIGTDAHSMEYRKPNLDKAFGILKTKGLETKLVEL